MKFWRKFCRGAFGLAGSLLFCSMVSAQQAPAKEAVSFDLLVTGATIVSMDADRHVIENGYLAVRGDEIVDIGQDAATQFRKGVIVKTRIDATGKLIIPGLINGHTHVPMTLMRGLIDDVVLDDWLRKYIFPAEARNVDEDFVRWGSRLGLAEMIRSGTTTFADMYYFEDAVAEETKAAGLRGVLGETWIDFPAPDNKNEAEMAAYTEKFIQKWKGDPQIHAAVAPHSIYTCSEKTLPMPPLWRGETMSPILIHLAEMRKEFDDSIAKNGATPVQISRTDRGVSGRMCWRRIASGRITPIKNSRRAAGWLRTQSVEQYDARKRRCAGRRSTQRGNAGGDLARTARPAATTLYRNMMEEMDWRRSCRKRIASTRGRWARRVRWRWRRSRARGRCTWKRKSVRWGKGKKADFVVLSLNAPNAVPMYDVYSQIVYALKGSDVESVVVGGKILLKDGKVLTVDEPKAIAKGREYGKKVAASLK